jgi:hypothetical protein
VDGCGANLAAGTKWAIGSFAADSFSTTAAGFGVAALYVANSSGLSKRWC